MVDVSARAQGPLSPKQGRPSGDPSRLTRGFSLLELLVAIGVVLILIGLAIPALSGARDEALAARMSLLLRSHVASVEMYTADHRDMYPVSGVTVGDAMLRWHNALVSSGHLAAAHEADPEGFKTIGSSRVALSACVAYPADRMQPGMTVPIDLAESSAVRTTEVAFPSHKGLFVQWLAVDRGEHVFWSWRPTGGAVRPIAMADGSGMRARCHDFALEFPFFENWVGHPVLTTWRGADGRDVLAR